MQKGDKFHLSFIVSPGVQNGFVAIFNDANPLHMSDDYARSKGFKSAVMHGNILNGFISRFVGEELPMENVIIHAQTIKYVAPVYLDDKLSFEAEIDDFFESVNTYELSFRFVNSAGKKVAKGTIQIGLLV